MASNRGSSRLLAVIIVWLIIVGVGAASYKFVISPWRGESARRAELSAEYEELSVTAADRGISASPIPDGADSKEIEQLLRDLKQRLTGGRPSTGSANHVALALDSFSGYSIWRSHQLRDETSAHGVTLDLVDDGADYTKRIRALRDGSIPLAVFTIDALIKTCATLGEIPATIVMVIDETIGADAMVAYKSAVPNIDSLNSQKARIVTTRDSPSETLARVVMANFQLPNIRSEPWIDADGAADVYRKLKQADRSEPRAFVLWEPYVSKALADSEVHVLMDSSRFRGYIVDVLVVQREYLLRHESVVASIVECYQRAAYDLRRQNEFISLIIDDARSVGEQLNKEQAKRLGETIWWKTTQENYVHMGVASSSSSRRAASMQVLDDMIRSITAVLVRTGAIGSDPTDDRPEVLYYDKILRGMHDSNFHPALIRSSTGSEDGEIRAMIELPALNEQQWDALTPVGTLQVDRIVFARGTAKLTRQSELALKRLVQTLHSWPQYYLQVRGHARSEGDMDANRKLATTRAEAAGSFLSNNGVSVHRVRFVGTAPSDGGGQAQAVSFVLGQMPY